MDKLVLKDEQENEDMDEDKDKEKQIPYNDKKKRD
jgi:hypothetical protein